VCECAVCECAVCACAVCACAVCACAVCECVARVNVLCVNVLCVWMCCTCLSHVHRRILTTFSYTSSDVAHSLRDKYVIWLWDSNTWHDSLLPPCSYSRTQVQFVTHSLWLVYMTWLRDSYAHCLAQILIHILSSWHIVRDSQKWQDSVT